MRQHEPKIVDSVSHETIRQVLKGNELKPWLKKEWCIPPKANAQFVYHMEDVLDVYNRPADLSYLLVCLDESPEQLVSETRQPLSAKPEQASGMTTNTAGKGQPSCSCSLPHSPELAPRQDYRPANQSRLG